MKKFRVIHPFLFAAFPILFLYSQNLGKMQTSVIFLPLAITIGFTALVLLLGLALKDVTKAGLIATIFLILFFSYGHFYGLVKGKTIGGFVIGRQLYMVPAWAIFFFLLAYLIFNTRRDLLNLTKILNVIAASLVLISLFNIVSFAVNNRTTISKSKSGKKNSGKAITYNKKTRPPDIYYIILDAYINNSTLRELYKFDNSKFTNGLKSKDFFIAEDSRSNYTQTWLSLSSSLNMEYINHLNKKYKHDNRTWILLSDMIKNNKVMNFLKQRGYKTINLGSGYSPTDNNKYVDIEINSGSINEFSRLLVRTTLLSHWENSIIGNDTRSRVLGTFAQLEKVPKIKGPKFVFAHIVNPHPPNVFDRDGKAPSQADLSVHENDWGHNYINQLVFINKKVEKLTDKILADSETPPIIIFQADHGSLSTFVDADSVRYPDSGWANPTATNLKERMRILNAYYLPNGGKKRLYKWITPVNSFRLIFNYYFDADFKMLDDQSYFSTYEYPFGFRNVTNIIKFDDEPGRRVVEP